MFKRQHHQRIAELLETFNAELLADAECYFCGGTAIVLALNEYRESVDIDFLCASAEGYRYLRNIVSDSLGDLLKTPVKHLREVRTDQYKIYTVLEIKDIPVKVELVREARVSIHGEIDPVLKVPTLSKDDLYTQKLLANADRGLDRSTMSRDIIDLAMMIQGWGDIPKAAWEKATEAYGDSLCRMFHKSVGMISDPKYLLGCLHKMQMDAQLLEKIPLVLERTASKLPLNELDFQEQQRRIADVSGMSQMAGVPYIFWKHASAAMEVAGSWQQINWFDVEKGTIIESIAENGQSPKSVIDFITKHSPGAVYADRQKIIEHNIERMAPQLQNRFKSIRQPRLNENGMTEDQADPSQ